MNDQVEAILRQYWPESGGQAGLQAATEAQKACADALRSDVLAELWDQVAEATAEWIVNNPGPSGIPIDPPQNPYR